MISQQSTSQTLVLVATNDYGATHRYELQNDQGVFVGKSSNCGLQLHDDSLADIHCRIGMEDGKLRIQNWMSASGTLVNGKEIDAERVIGTNDTVQIGGHKIHFATSVKAADEFTPDSGVSKQPTTSRAVQTVLAEPDATTDPHARDLELVNDDTKSLLESPTSSLLEPIMKEPSETEGRVKDPTAADPQEELELQLNLETDSMDMDVDFFSFEEEDTYDRETVALLQAEIEDLRSALAQRDAESMDDLDVTDFPTASSPADASDEVLQRMQELIEEANQSDERVVLLEEMLHAAEDANRSERQERSELEAWVRDIEARIGQREDEHAAEIDAFKLRFQESSDQQERMQAQLRKAAASGSSATNPQVEEILANLQQANRELQERLSDSQKECLSLQKRVEAAEGDQENVLRGERAKIAKEQAKIARLRYELSSKMAEIEQIPQSGNSADQETGQRIRALREHLREIHEEEKLEPKDASLATRLSNLWKRVEY